MRSCQIVAFIGLLWSALPFLAAEDYQWSLPVDQAAFADVPYAKEVQAQAFLWIPPACKQVRAVLIAQNNMEEPTILAHPTLRKTLAELGIAEIFVNRTLGSIHFRYDRGEDLLLERLLKTFADTSGYQELATAPLLPLGHSAMASFPWDIAMWKPERTLAALSVSGQWPLFKDQTPENLNGSPDWGDRTIDGVPGLITKGEYEVGGSLLKGWYAGLHGNYRTRFPNTFLTQVVEPGCGHFEVSDEKVAFLARFIQKAVQYRLPTTSAPGEAPKLRPVTPKDGWLYDTWRLDQAPVAPAAPNADYKGDRSQSYSAFDAGMAKTIEDFQGRFRNQKPSILSFTTPKGVVPHRGDHIDCHIPFEPLADGVTLPIGGVFADRFPWEKGSFAGRNLKKDDPVESPTGEERRIVTRVICGSVRPIGPSTVVVSLDRMTMKLDPGQPIGACVWLDYPGNAAFKRVVQQGEIKFWPQGKGTEQTITFAKLEDQKSASLRPIKLAAQSSAGLPVRYFVRSGPAEIDANGTLVFTPIPLRSRFPLSVTVVAWQIGCGGDKPVKAAPLAEQTFQITR